LNKKEEKKKDNKIIRLIKRFIKDIYYKYGKTKIKKVYNEILGFLI
jgi:hypothetical protein